MRKNEKEQKRTMQAITARMEQTGCWIRSFG